MTALVWSRLRVQRGDLRVERALACLLVLVVAGCSGPVVTAYPAWQAEFDRALARDDLSDFQRNILPDYDITDAECDEAQQRWQRCVEDYGFTVNLDRFGHSVEDPSLGFGATQAELDDSYRQMSEASDLCMRQYTSAVGTLYRAIVGNPENNDPMQMTVDCLVRNGFVEAGYTISDHQSLMESGGDPLDLDRSRQDLIIGCINSPAEF